MKAERSRTVHICAVQPADGSCTELSLILDDESFLNRYVLIGVPRCPLNRQSEEFAETAGPAPTEMKLLLNEEEVLLVGFW